MIIPDVNILLYAHNVAAEQHEAARGWWQETLESRESVGLPWSVILGFIRIASRQGAVPRPLSVQACEDAVANWFNSPIVTVVTPGPEHRKILFELLKHSGTAGNLTTDAHLAALAIEYNAEVASTDTDFARFPKVRWFNPIAPRRRR